MATVGFLVDDKKLGDWDQQRARIGPVDHEFYPDQIGTLLDGLFIREGDTLIVPHARALGRYQRGFALREERLKGLAAMNVSVQIGADGIAEIYDAAEKRARFHAAALLPTGITSPKQKKNPGRPKTYRKPEGEALEMAQEWWAGPLHWKDVGKLIGQAMDTKPVSRATMNAWLGPRPPHPDRVRKPRSDKKQ